MDRSEEIMPVSVAIKQVRILFAESLRFPGEGSSAQGKSVPKPRPKGVGDGKLVNIPVPNLTAMGGRSRLIYPGVGCPGTSK